MRTYCDYQIVMGKLNQAIHIVELCEAWLSSSGDIEPGGKLKLAYGKLVEAREDVDVLLERAYDEEHDEAQQHAGVDA